MPVDPVTWEGKTRWLHQVPYQCGDLSETRDQRVKWPRSEGTLLPHSAVETEAQSLSGSAGWRGCVGMVLRVVPGVAEGAAVPICSRTGPHRIEP